MHFPVPSQSRRRARRISYGLAALLASTLAAVCAYAAWPKVTLRPDLSTPKAAALAFARAAEAGDIATQHLAAIGTEAQFAGVKGTVTVNAAIRRFETASVAKFGDKGKVPIELSQSLSEMIAASEAKIDGDKATLISIDSPNDPHPIALKKDGADWKVDLDSLPPENLQAGAFGNAAAEAIDAVAASVATWKYATPEQAIAAMGDAMQTASKAAVFDLSTPKGAAMAFARAADAGDIPATHKLAIGTNAQFESFQAFMNYRFAIRRFDAASTKHFGDKGKLPPVQAQTVEEYVTTSEVTIDGNKATLSSGLIVMKMGQEWKVDLVFLPPEFPSPFKFRIAADAIDRVSEGVAAGKYATFEAAFTEFERESDYPWARAPQTRPTTGPTTAPDDLAPPTPTTAPAPIPEPIPVPIPPAPAPPVPAPPAVPAPTATQANPAYESWAKRKPGSSVTLKISSEAAGTKTEMEMTYVLKEVTTDKVIVETTMAMAGTKMPGTAMNIPNSTVTGTVSPTAVPHTAKESDETIQVAGKSYKCHVVETSTDSNGTKFTSKVWTCPEVPNLIVKMESSSEGSFSSKTKMEVIRIDLK